ncbi:hypothetical protein N0M98_31035 [Paenibacillus doosanensis]|uniref:hypothetical protein n=1 Tax=Paenibacillus konkukensis TaxID=2020716 RepID=UPI00201E54B4|nr:hypothetical protein [Paenibacillus konkukensis]MCS7464536.1 hypothetical protein [Paenibacillus doosanensis]
MKLRGFGCTWFGLEEIAADEIKYVVTITEYQNQLVIIRNKKGDLWELPGGKRENDNFEITPYGEM